MRIFKSITFATLLVTMGIFISLSYSVAQRSTSQSAPHRFELGEELHFEAEFSRALLRNIDVADLKFRATRTPLESASTNTSQPYALTFKADVSSKGFFARLFNLKFRERVE